MDIAMFFFFCNVNYFPASATHGLKILFKVAPDLARR